MHYMFEGCYLLESLDIYSFNTSKVVNMLHMFYSCFSLKSLNISNFDTSNVKNMWGMFAHSFSLISLNLSNFNTSSTTDMRYMFNNCSSLVLLDISNFDTFNVGNMLYMFTNCFLLTSLDVTNFDTSNVRSMSYMFNNCKSLISLELEKFKTSNTIDMGYMFSDCSKLISLNLSNFDTTKVTNMRNMFSGCFNLKLLDISNFDTSQVKTMISMFYQCFSLSSLNLSNFITSKVTDIEYMFSDCWSLTLLDLSNFYTANVRNFDCLFANCSSLISLDITNFDTSNVKNMHRVFYNCSSLVSLDLSKFNTSKVKLMNSMFNICSSLTSLNLSSFDTSQVTFFQWMFNGTSNMEYINMKSFTFKKLRFSNNILDYIPDNIAICINENNDANVILKHLENKACHIIDCTNDWKIKQKKLIKLNYSCIDNCHNKFNNINDIVNCLETCTNGNIMNNKSFFNICKCEKEECLLYTNNNDITKDLCHKFNYNFYPKEDDLINISEYINCYKEPKGYYLDNNDLIYKKCYERCDTCDKSGDNKTHNSIKCKSDFSFEFFFNKSLNCYPRCNKYYFFDNDYNYYCTGNNEKDICPEIYDKLIPNKNKCVKNCEEDETYKYEFRKTCYQTCPIPNSILSNNTPYFCEAVCTKDFPYKILKTQECVKICDFDYIINNLCVFQYPVNQTKEESKSQEIEAKDALIKSIDSSITSGKVNTSKLDSGQEEIIRDEKMTVTVTTLSNQKNNMNSNMTSINFGDCEITLRNHYNISYDKMIYMNKIDVFQEGMKIPKVEYSVFQKINESYFMKLDLTLCRNDKVEISVPIIIAEDIDKLNISSGYYNDICYISTSDNGTDIILKDRKNDLLKIIKWFVKKIATFLNMIIYIKKLNARVKLRKLQHHLLI